MTTKTSSGPEVDRVEFVSNLQTSNNFQIIVRLIQGCGAGHYDQVVRWFLACLEGPRFAAWNVAGMFPWNVVSSAQNMSDPADDEWPAVYIALRLGEFHSPFYHHTTQHGGLTVLTEDAWKPHEQMKATLLLMGLRESDPPICIRAVGVSAVSDDFMMDLWAEIISPEARSFDLPGAGFKVHPMWCRTPDEEWITVPERSFNFGWRGYDPTKRVEFL